MRAFFYSLGIPVQPSKDKFQTKVKKATTSEKLVMAEKLRKMTSGADVLIAKMGLVERKRG